MKKHEQKESEYKKRLRLEKEREKQYRESEQGAFEAAMLHLDDTASYGDGDGGAEADNDQPREWESDDGEGAERVRSCDQRDAWSSQSFYTARKSNARRRLVRYDPNLVDVFDLVLKNGTNRKESICELMKRIRIAPASEKRTAEVKRRKERNRKRRYRKQRAGTRQGESTIAT